MYTLLVRSTWLRAGVAAGSQYRCSFPFPADCAAQNGATGIRMGESHGFSVRAITLPTSASDEIQRLAFQLHLDIDVLFQEIRWALGEG